MSLLLSFKNRFAGNHWHDNQSQAHPGVIASRAVSARGTNVSVRAPQLISVFPIQRVPICKGAPTAKSKKWAGSLNF
jgi:hypothetical protein